MFVCVSRVASFRGFLFASLLIFNLSLSFVLFADPSQNSLPIAAPCLEVPQQRIMFMGRELQNHMVSCFVLLLVLNDIVGPSNFESCLLTLLSSCLRMSSTTETWRGWF